MNKQRFVAIAGLWVAILPYLGIPFSWKKTILFFTGIAILIVGYLLYRERRSILEERHNTSKPFMEGRPETGKEIVKENLEHVRHTYFHPEQNETTNTHARMNANEHALNESPEEPKIIRRVIKRRVRKVVTDGIESPLTTSFENNTTMSNEWTKH